MVSRKEGKQKGQSPKLKRPHEYWKEFNDWWRAEHEREGRRPNLFALELQWKEWDEDRRLRPTTLPALWQGEGNFPTLDAMKTHAKGMKTLVQLRAFFRDLRARKHPHHQHPECLQVIHQQSNKSAEPALQHDKEAVVDDEATEDEYEYDNGSDDECTDDDVYPGLPASIRQRSRKTSAAVPRRRSPIKPAARRPSAVACGAARSMGGMGMDGLALQDEAKEGRGYKGLEHELTRAVPPDGLAGHGQGHQQKQLAETGKQEQQQEEELQHAVAHDEGHWQQRQLRAAAAAIAAEAAAAAGSPNQASHGSHSSDLDNGQQHPDSPMVQEQPQPKRWSARGVAIERAAAEGGGDGIHDTRHAHYRWHHPQQRSNTYGGAAASAPNSRHHGSHGGMIPTPASAIGHRSTGGGGTWPRHTAPARSHSLHSAAAHVLGRHAHTELADQGHAVQQQPSSRKRSHAGAPHAAPSSALHHPYAGDRRHSTHSSGMSAGGSQLSAGRGHKQAAAPSRNSTARCSAQREYASQGGHSAAASHWAAQAQAVGLNHLSDGGGFLPAAAYANVPYALLTPDMEYAVAHAQGMPPAKRAHHQGYTALPQAYMYPTSAYAFVQQPPYRAGPPGHALLLAPGGGAMAMGMDGEALMSFITARDDGGLHPGSEAMQLGDRLAAHAVGSRRRTSTSGGAAQSAHGDAMQEHEELFGLVGMSEQVLASFTSKDAALLELVSAAAALTEASQLQYVDYQ